MKSASIQELKATLKTMPQAQVVELCLRLARFKKDNKELLTFLLFEADDLPAYITAVKKDVDSELAGINTASAYWAKKSLRKVLRLLNKHIRYTGSKTAEAELRMHFCEGLKRLPGALFRSPAVSNLYYGQLKKAEAALKGMHEDLQRDYRLQLEGLRQE